MHVAHSSHPPRRRGGFTVVEVLTALPLVSVGLLGMAGTTALTLRTVTVVTRERRALRRLDLRLAALTAEGCGRAANGTISEPGESVWEQWTVTAVVQGAALVDASVRWREGSRMRSVTHRSAILC